MTYPSNDDSDGDSDVTSVADSEVHLKNDFCDDESDGNIIADSETHSENDLCDGENDGNIVADSETHSENDLCDGNSDPDSEAHSENESSHNPTLMDEIALPTTHVWKQDWNRENETVSQSDYDSNGWSITGPPPTDNLDMNELKINSQPVQQQTQLLVALSQTDVNEVTSINAGVDDELSVHFPPFLNSLVAAQGPISSTVDIEDNYENEIGIADSSDISVVEAITVDKGNFVVNPANNDERTSPFFVPVADDSYSDNDDEVLRHTIMKKQLYFTTLDKSLSSSAGDFDVQFPALQDQKLKTRSDDTVAVLKTKEETASSSVDNNKTCATTVNVNDVDEDKNSAQGLAERELFHKIMREESDEDTVRALRTPVHGVREVKPFGNATSVDENEEERDYFPKYDSGGDNAPFDKSSLAEDVGLTEKLKRVASQITRRTLEKTSEEKKKSNDRVRNQLKKNRQYSAVNVQAVSPERAASPSFPPNQNFSNPLKQRFSISPGHKQRIHTEWSQIDTALDDLEVISSVWINQS
jgi:hypothetical protein